MSKRMTIRKPAKITKPAAAQTALQKFKGRLGRKGTAYGRAVGLAAVTSKKSTDAKEKRVDQLFDLLLIITEAPKDILASPWHLLAEVAPVIKAAKVTCKAAAKKKAEAEGIEGDALKRLLKGSTKGLKDYMPDMGNFLELVNVDFESARQTVTLQPGRRKLVWAEASAVWKTELEDHVSAIKMPTAVGVDVEDPRRKFVLGSDYKKTFRKDPENPVLDDDGNERVNVVFGPNGAKRSTECIVSEQPKGALYDEVRETLLELGDLVSNNNDFVRKSETDERADYPEFILPHDGKVDIPEDARARFLGLTLKQYRDAMPKKG